VSTVVPVIADLQLRLAITYWNRLEPRPRSPEIADALAARVRDPLFLLTRQWQLGEFHGEDAGSPALVQLKGRTGPFLGWRPAGSGPLLPLPAPLEELVASEDFTPDLATRVELGQSFEALLADEGLAGAVLDAIVAAFRTAHPIQAAAVPATDADASRFALVTAGRAIDGVAVAVAGPGSLPADPAVAAEAVRVARAVTALRDEIAQTLGTVGLTDAPAWQRERMEYQAEAVALDPERGPVLLTADPDRDGTFEWFTFDLRAESPAGALADTVPGDEAQPSSFSESRLPAYVRFRGMPNPRFWDFERGPTDFGAVTPDRRDVAKLLLMDFMLVHGNDYFVVPFDQPVGTACRIDALVVQDVFEGLTLVERADIGPAEARSRWTCFSTAIADLGGRPAEVFLVPPSAGSLRLGGDALEEVRFLRDEQANYVWAVEHLAEGGHGLPRPGHERNVAESAAEPAAAEPASESPLVYTLQTFVPRHWFPMLPVALDATSGETVLEQGRMVRPDGTEPGPAGRVLAHAAEEPYRVREETVPRVGLRVLRETARCRGALGATHLWIARRVLAGRGEGSSGLRYDVARVLPPKPPLP
jgi:hypothetical protein